MMTITGAAGGPGRRRRSQRRTAMEVPLIPMHYIVTWLPRQEASGVRSGRHNLLGRSCTSCPLPDCHLQLMHPMNPLWHAAPVKEYPVVIPGYLGLGFSAYSTCGSRVATSAPSTGPNVGAPVCWCDYILCGNCLPAKCACVASCSLLIVTQSPPAISGLPHSSWYRT
jgi:hypothetical protein